MPTLKKGFKLKPGLKLKKEYRTPTAKPTPFRKRKRPADKTFIV